MLIPSISPLKAVIGACVISCLILLGGFTYRKCTNRPQIQASHIEVAQGADLDMDFVRSHQFLKAKSEGSLRGRLEDLGCVDGKINVTVVGKKLTLNINGVVFKFQIEEANINPNMPSQMLAIDEQGLPALFTPFCVGDPSDPSHAHVMIIETASTLSILATEEVPCEYLSLGNPDEKQI